MPERSPLPFSLLQIAGLRLAVRAEPGGPPLWIPPASARFAIEPDGRAADVEVTCRWGDLAVPFAGRLVFDSGGPWKLFQHEAGERSFRFATPRLRPHAYKAARFSADFRRGEVVFHAPYFTSPLREGLYPLEHPLDELVMVNLLSAGLGVELHACGLVDTDGQGLLFLGPSGAGKSTTARLWRAQEGVRILGDDRIVVRRDARDGRLWMHGTPWQEQAELARPERAPLSAAFLLRQADENRLTPCRGADLVAHLATCSFPTFHSARGLGSTLGFLTEVAQEIPGRVLDFQPDPSVVGFVRAATARPAAAIPARVPSERPSVREVALRPQPALLGTRGPSDSAAG